MFSEYVLGNTSANNTKMNVINIVAKATPLSPVRAIAADVANAEAKTLTVLFPIKIVDKKSTLCII